MRFQDSLAIIIGKVVSLISKTFRLGAGATWPGEAALMISPSILRSLSSQFTKGIILVAGTNGKTTTALMLKTILTHEKLSVVHNNSGANLLNGLVSSCLTSAATQNDYGVFEVDENSLPVVLRFITPKAIVILNLFRDQLDRYGEVDVIAEKWKKSIATLTEETTLVLNADDPLIASLGKNSKARVVYFGLTEKADAVIALEHATDSIFCLFCGARLLYYTYYFSHLGDWYCNVCGEKRPELALSSFESPLPGLYNTYNTLGAVLTAQTLGIQMDHIKNSLVGFTPAFGRQEEFKVGDKKIKLFLSKNPAGFNASLRAVLDMKPSVMLLCLNDRIPDGRDISWIWDVDFEKIPPESSVVVSGDRVYDMALRIKYCEHNKLIVEPVLKNALSKGLETIQEGETLYILATYSAMLEVRKILTGKKIL